jgi:two-component system cell cycle sensor histidine kinase/response regulator CckA
LMVSDVLMPVLSGPALAERFAVLHPETQSLFMAGLPDHPEVVRGVANAGKHFLPKPFGAERLVNKVQEVLLNP